MGRWTLWCLDGNPELQPELHLGDVGISESPTWEAVEERPWPVPVGTDRTAVVRRLAPVSTGEGNGDRPAPANPIHENRMNYRRPTERWHTDAGSTPPVPNILPAGVAEGVAREAPQRTTALERSFPASSRAEQSSSSRAARAQAPADPQVTNPHAGAQLSSSPTSAPATQATLPRLPDLWRQYWDPVQRCNYYYHCVSGANNLDPTRVRGC